jgi:hypothetical protein
MDGLCAQSRGQPWHCYWTHYSDDTCIYILENVIVVSCRQDVVMSMVEKCVFSISLLDTSRNSNYVDLSYLISKLSIYNT